MSSAFLPSSSNQTELQKPEFSIAELDKQVIMVDSAKDNYTSLALVQAVILWNNVVNLAKEGSGEIHDLLVMQQV